MAIIVMVYGLVILAGGAIGFVKARSRPSLLSGLGFGLALVASGVALAQGVRAGLIVALGLAVVLTVVMGARYVRTRKPVPAGLIALVSLGAAIFFGWSLCR